jgi:hypothetical protein
MGTESERVAGIAGLRARIVALGRDLRRIERQRWVRNDEVRIVLRAPADAVVPAAERAGDHEVLPVGIVATACSAARKSVGNTRPRSAARRRMPAAARGLKQYLGDTLD